MEEQAIIFDPYAQVNRSITLKNGGTGLGLYICKQTIEKMGGTIVVNSAVGQGSVFRFTIALKKESEVTESQGAEHLVSASRRLRVLLVDDQADMNIFVSAFLKQSPYFLVEYCRNGSSAVRTYTSDLDKFDVVLMDWEMPTMNGIEAVKEIRREERESSLKPVKIVIFSGHEGDEKREVALTSGCDVFLSKPFSKEELLELLDKLAKE
ncbi:response regulator [Patescibacteria group bacterium]|nr:response regulator [Patescibacteria group bacterium]